ERCRVRIDGNAISLPASRSPRTPWEDVPPGSISASYRLPANSIRYSITCPTGRFAEWSVRRNESGANARPEQAPECPIWAVSVMRLSEHGRGSATADPVYSDRIRPGYSDLPVDDR